MGNELISLISMLFQILDFLLIARVLFSWVQPSPGEFLYELYGIVYNLTEPLCHPFRLLLPPMAGFDFSIILVFISLDFFRDFILRFAGA